MKKLLRTIIVVLFLFCVFLLIRLNTTRLGGTKTNEVALANPASIYCEQQSWTLEIVTDSSGGQSWLCHLSDGTTCEERAYIRGECPVTGAIAITGEVITGASITTENTNGDIVQPEVTWTNIQTPVTPAVTNTNIPTMSEDYNEYWTLCWISDSEGKPNNKYFVGTKFVNQVLQEVRDKGQEFTVPKINELYDTFQWNTLDNCGKRKYGRAIYVLQNQPGYVTSYTTTQGVTKISIDFVSYKETLEEIDFWPPNVFFQTKNTSKKARTYTLDTKPDLQTLYTDGQWYVTLDQKKIYLNNLNQRLNQFCNNEKIYTQNDWTNINWNEQNMYCIQERLSPGSNYWPSIIYFEFNAVWEISKIDLNWRWLSTAG